MCLLAPDACIAVVIGDCFASGACEAAAAPIAIATGVLITAAPVLAKGIGQIAPNDTFNEHTTGNGHDTTGTKPIPTGSNPQGGQPESLPVPPPVPAPGGGGNMRGNSPPPTSNGACEEPQGDQPGSGNLTPEQLRAIRSYNALIREHEQKLADYIANPDAYDNKGLLKNAPSEEVRQRIIDGRVRHLQKEIDTFRENIAKITGEYCE